GAALLGNVLAAYAHALRARHGVPRDAGSANGTRPATPRPAANRRTRRRAGGPAEAQRAVPWHARAAEAVAAALATTQESGLSQAAAQARLQHDRPPLPPEAVPHAHRPTGWIGNGPRRSAGCRALGGNDGPVYLLYRGQCAPWPAAAGLCRRGGLGIAEECTPRVKDCEAVPETTAAWVRIAMIPLMVRQLAARACPLYTHSANTMRG